VLGVAQRAGAEAAGAARGAADTVVASAAVGGGIDAAVWCSCRPSRGKRVCGGMYYSLKQCNAADACPDACKEKGMTFKGCIGQPTVTWYSAAGIAWVDCAATGSLLGVAQRAGAEAAGAVSTRRR